jgi:hypothetical protein
MGDRLLRRVNDVVQRQVAGEVFLVPIRGHLADLQELFVLSETGRSIWERLDGRHSVDDLVAALVAEFEVEEEQAQSDALKFLGQLEEAGLIEQAVEMAEV